MARSSGWYSPISPRIAGRNTSRSRGLDDSVTLTPMTGGRLPEVVQSRARAAHEHVTHKPGPLFREGYRSPGEGCRACAGTSGVLFCNRYLGRQVNAAVEITGTGDAQPSA